jgi:GPH family glycoside/pentoside/hexuronide:cation symporter
MEREASPSTVEVFGYALSAAPSTFGYLLILVMYMKYATETLGASPAAVGLVFFIAKFWDAIADPLIGTLSDRTRSRLGRRRPWLLAAAPLLAAFGYMAWVPPADLASSLLIPWITVAVLGYYTAHTIFGVPHMAYGAELSLQSTGRNRVFAARQVIQILSMLAAGIIGTTLVQKGYEATRSLSLVVSALTIVLVFLGVTLLPAERVEFQGRGGRNPYRALRDVVANPHARLFLMVIFIDSIGTGGIGILTPFVIDHVVGRKDLLPYLLGANMLSMLAAVPIWLWLARYFEKRRLLLWAMLGSGMGFGSILLVGRGDWALIAISAVVSGAALSCSNTLGYTLKSEIIDCDEHATGERKEGAYFAGWSFVQKLAAGLMFYLVGQALEWSGFDGSASQQSVLVERTMIGLMGGFPLVCYALGAIAFARFSLSESEHALIRRELNARAAENADQGGTNPA